MTNHKINLNRYTTQARVRTMLKKKDQIVHRLRNHQVQRRNQSKWTGTNQQII